jgi:hypothetical protein
MRNHRKTQAGRLVGLCVPGGSYVTLLYSVPYRYRIEQYRYCTVPFFDFKLITYILIVLVHFKKLKIFYLQRKKFQNRCDALVSYFHLLGRTEIVKFLRVFLIVRHLNLKNSFVFNMINGLHGFRSNVSLSSKKEKIAEHLKYSCSWILPQKF